MNPKPTPLKAIRKLCLGCCGGRPKEVRYCPLTDCPNWPFRFGRTPEAAKRRFGEKGRGLLDESCFIEGSKFDPGKSTTEMGS
jgi:hypothetical protein